MVKSSSMVASIVGSSECRDCLGQPPPHFGLPPPPRPPYLHDLADCSQAQFIDMKSCNAIPVIDAEYHSSPALPSLGLIAVCSVLLLVFIMTLVTLLWKHKKKIQNFSPCKSSPQNRCDASHGNSVIYEDLTNICPRQLPQQTVPMVDMKNPSVDIPFHLSLFACTPRPPSNGYVSQDPYNPIYEELSYGPRDKEGSRNEIRASLSDDDFAEDELSIGEKERDCPKSVPSSLRGSLRAESPRNHDSRDLSSRMRYMTHNGRDFIISSDYTKKPKKRDLRCSNSERVSHRSSKKKIADNILLDAFFNCHPDRVASPYTLPVNAGGQCDISSHSNREFTTFRPSQDSDSGYSHNTFGGRGSSRVRTEYHLPYSLDFILS